MNNIAMYREDFQAAVKEIAAAGGNVKKIFHNQIFFTQNGKDFVFAPEQGRGAVFIKQELKPEA